MATGGAGMERRGGKGKGLSFSTESERGARKEQLVETAVG